MIVHEIKTVAKLVASSQGRKILLRELFFRGAKHFTPALAADANGMRFYVSTADKVVGRYTFVHRGFDEHAMRRIVRQLSAHTGVSEPLRGKSFLDIGGNIGTTSVYALRIFGASDTITFEPVPSNVRLLRQNLLVNDVTDHVRLFAIALSDADGEVEFELSEENSGDHRVRVSVDSGTPRSHKLFGEDHREVIRVPAQRLDALVAAGEVRLDRVGLVWIDVQGHEAHVLAGADKVLDARIPIVVEYWPYGLRRAQGLERFHKVVAGRFKTVLDLGPPLSLREPKALPASQIGSLQSSYTGPLGSADLLLLP